MRRPIIAGNWKMNKTKKEAVALVSDLKDKVSANHEVDIVVCPPFTVLDAVFAAIAGSNIKLGAQNVYFEKEGAFTGELAPAMLKDIGCDYVIIGHSERRLILGESNEQVNKKIKASLGEGLTPIVCMGETLEQRESGNPEEVVKRQFAGSFKDIAQEEILKCIIAYEPVWAIGTGKTATPDQANEMHAFIRKLLKESYDNQVAEELRIQYGGSVKPGNIKDLMAGEDIDGALVGGASLEVGSFLSILDYE